MLIEAAVVKCFYIAPKNSKKERKFKERKTRLRIDREAVRVFSKASVQRQIFQTTNLFDISQFSCYQEIFDTFA